MPERADSPDVVRLTRRVIEAADHGDFETAPLEQWFGMLEASETTVAEVRELGNGVILVHLLQRARPRGSTAWRGGTAGRVEGRALVLALAR
jgi:hypothetical protein